MLTAMVRKLDHTGADADADGGGRKDVINRERPT
jgi:hypothetical protein